MFRVLGSNEELLVSGVVWNKSFLIILDDIPLLKYSTCFLVYFIKASEYPLPANMIKIMGTLSKNIDIAALDPTEWVPISFDLNPIFASPISVTSNLNSFRRVSWFMYLTVPSFMNENMVMSRFDPGRLRLFWNKAEADLTGQSTWSPVFSCVFLSIFSPFFVFES